MPSAGKGEQEATERYEGTETTEPAREFWKCRGMKMMSKGKVKKMLPACGGVPFRDWADREDA